jgi:Kef-type K+ transport system membrane component KefB
MQALLSLSISLLVGLLLSRPAKLLKLPAVTAYLVAGIVVGPFVLGAFGVPGLGFVSAEDVKSYSIICDVALGFIAFSIGNEFRLSQLKNIGKQATIVGIFQAVVTTVLVDAALILMHLAMPDKLPLPAAIVLGAVASATAPAATLMVVRQYKAKGPLTNLLLPIVALDDAVGLIIFAVLFGVAKAIDGGSMNLVSIIVEPLIEIFASLLVGALLGYLLSKAEKLFHSNSNRLSLVITFIFATVAITELQNLELFGVHLHFSSLLTCMMCGTVFCNVCECSDEMMARSDSWSKPLLILFFVLSGAELDLSVFTQPLLVLVGVVYIVSRCIGKYFGAMSSAKLTKCSPDIVKYLGITLFPQAGVALGMISTVKGDNLLSGDIANVVSFVILFAVLVYEIVGPVMTKWALTKAGDITEKPSDSSKRRKNVEHERHDRHWLGLGHTKK